MDNLTHSLVGLAAAKAGLERTSPYATALCVVAANAPDADIVVRLAGPWEYLEHHRGITHSIIGTFAIALLLPVIFYVAEWAWARWRRRPPRAKFRGLLISSLILSVSHPLLDWTNSYGVRPLLPWNAQWFYGDLVFILDPWLWLSVGGAAFLLTAKTGWRTAVWTALALLLTAGVWLLPQRAGIEYPLASRVLWVAGLAGLATLHRFRIATRWDASLAAVALALVVAYWGVLAGVHRVALRRAEIVAERLAQGRGENVVRVAATPTLADPLTWRCLAETDRGVHRFDISASGGGGDDADDSVRNHVWFEKPRGEAAETVARAAKDQRAEVFLGFARFPVARVVRSCTEQIVVQFADLRYAEPGGAERGGFAVQIPVPDTPPPAARFSK
ncbi:MAG: metal-dependent hydrolase [Acidobacteriota bacterium]|nr:metal-dependent hydrolase [Acidobacteriota bacterium]